MSFERPVVKCEESEDKSQEIIHRVVPKPHTFVALESRCACGHSRAGHCQCGATCQAEDCKGCDGYNQEHVDHGEADERVP